MPDAYTFPDDTTFERALLDGDLYHKRVCFHLLDGLENRDQNEQSATSSYSIEHVLPQNEKLSDAWREMLGPDWRQIQQTWLHRLGNLTLTGYNSTYKDKPLAEKQTVQNGFQHSSVRLNQDIRDAVAWTPTEISARGVRLAARALKVWPMLDADRQMIRAMERSELQARASRRKTDQVEMTPEARALFSDLRNRIMAAFPTVIEMAEARSVSYHDPEFFLEAIPRKRGLSLLIGIDYNEVEEATETVQDTSAYTFIMNSTYQGGVLIVVRNPDQLDQAMRIIAQARALVSQ